MDRLIALVTVYWRNEWRSLLRARERLIGVATASLGLMLSSLLGALLAFVGLRFLSTTHPDLLLPVISMLATGAGVTWAVAPLVSGVALSETHDVGRVVHFPVRGSTLVAASLVANLLQPAVIAQAATVMAVAAAAAPRGWPFLLALTGVLAAFAFVLVAAQLAGLALQAVSRNRRLADIALFVGLGTTLLLSLVPLVAFLGMTSSSAVRDGLEAFVRWDPFRFSPFGWGARAAVHAGRGEWGAFSATLALQCLAIVVAGAAASATVLAIHRGELSLSTPGARRRRARMTFSGPVGALVEKDVRVSWRDPSLRAALFAGLTGLLVFLLFITQLRRGGTGPGFVLGLGSFVGVAAFGANAFGFERRGLALLLAFPVPRWKVLVAKNVASLTFRLPGLLTVVAAGVVTGAAALLPAALVIAVVTMAVVAALDNYLSILFPIAAPAPGANPHATISGGRGWTAALSTALTLFAAIVMSAPFAFLAWLPYLLGRPLLWSITLPLALVGVAGLYGLLVAGAARLLVHREPELLARVLGEA